MTITMETTNQSNMDYLSKLPATADIDKIIAIHKKRQQWVNQDKKGFLRFREPFQRLATLSATYTDFSTDVVTIGKSDEIEDNQQAQLKQDLRCFMPWRKGPFSVFGIEIDAEWRSEYKWSKVVPKLPDLHNKVICDIGSNNGYYMFRMSDHRPRMVLGLEPSVQHYYCFKSLNEMAGIPNLYTDLLGVEHLSFFTQSFDVIFLMGIIYHRPSPIDTLRDILTALKPGGTLILESQAIPGEESVALFPDKTYAKVPSTYFVPTGPCLINWMKRAGFMNVELFCSHPMSSSEQRRTDWMVFESYQDYLDPEDPSKTIEGYQAPLRVYLRGEKK